MDFLCKNIECAVCHLFPISPLYSCKNGHIICGICADKGLKCPSPCNEIEDTYKPCAWTEMLLKKYELGIPCRNMMQGCQIILKPSEMIEHILSACEFRSIICDLDPESSCGEIELTKVHSHLVQRHNITTVDGQTNGKLFLFNKFPPSAITVNYPTEITAMKFDKNVFLILGTVKRGILYQCVAVIGDDSVANQYKFSVFPPDKMEILTLTDTDFGKCEDKVSEPFPQDSKFIFDSAVKRQYDVQPLQEVNLRGWHLPRMETYDLKKILTDPDHRYYCWTDEFEIIKISSNNSSMEIESIDH